VGRSNLQNDELTTKIGRRTDYWLHTQKIHGSHVIIRCDGELPPEKTIEQAAIIAAYYSQGRDAGKIPVDFTMLKYVKKPSGALPGKVIYTDYSTILVESDETLVKRLKK
jgi:predicted ribosome quality control (RQC) complex YloA/Tae2 family protein